MKKIEQPQTEQDEMLPEYDFTGKQGVRGKYYRAYRQGHTVNVQQANGTVSIHYFNARRWRGMDTQQKQTSCKQMLFLYLLLFLLYVATLLVELVTSEDLVLLVIRGLYLLTVLGLMYFQMARSTEPLLDITFFIFIVMVSKDIIKPMLISFNMRWYYADFAATVVAIIISVLLFILIYALNNRQARGTSQDG
jgi:hypothetical protein